MSEVSQAKQILLLGSLDKQEKDLTAREETSVSSNPSNSPTSEPEGARADILSSVMSPKLSNSVTGQKRRACEEYKLAARFKNFEMGIQVVRPRERGRARECQDLNSTMASTFRPSPPSRSCLGTEGLANCDQTSQMSSRTGAGANQREDILFRKMDPLCFTGTLKTSGSRANSTLPPCTSSDTPSDLDRHIKSLVSTAESSTTSTSSLKRVNSFSGLPSPKQANEENGISESVRSGSYRRTRSSSLSRVKTVSRELIVPAVMWNYMKVAYHSDISALISDLKVSESQTDKNKVVVGLKGTDSSTVEERQHQLQELVDRVASDFCVKQLKLADLGVAKYDEVLEAFCSHIRSRFRKVLIKSLTDTLVLSGPKSLCSQAIKMLKEVFHSEVSNSGPVVNITQESIDQGRAKTPSHTSVQRNSQITPNLTSKNTQDNMAGQFKAFQSEHWRPSSMQPHKPVVKEKLKKDGLEHLKTSKSSTLESKSSRVNEGILFDRQRPSTPTTQKTISAASVTGKQTNCPVHTQPETCVCGKSSPRVVQTSCGVFLCPQCLPIHAQCMTCSEVKAVKESLPEMPVHSHRVEQKIEKVTGKEASKGQKREQGIHGTMTIVELSLTLPGHDRYPTVKITYRIPDGIQGEEHPNPGSPFQGGVFEAYLPLNSKGRALLQCLDKAFKQGLIFTVCSGTKTGSTAKIAWNRIPHKTNISGGKSGNGYPDSTYLNDLSDALKACGIEAV
ncbi:E3 ubiquitin-protein ligase DTX3L [Trichomycterus rosablanca]|uniref:E3 ubiquitin-protein ligase DTX3L n=1 Tax=Trichomycterus rosablanca TaxID=2290929 RepID=UPI002F35DBDC